MGVTAAVGLDFFVDFLALLEAAGAADAGVVGAAFNPSAGTLRLAGGGASAVTSAASSPSPSTWRAFVAFDFRAPPAFFWVSTGAAAAAGAGAGSGAGFESDASVGSALTVSSACSAFLSVSSAAAASSPPDKSIGAESSPRRALSIWSMASLNLARFMFLSVANLSLLPV